MAGARAPQQGSPGHTTADSQLVTRMGPPEGSPRGPARRLTAAWLIRTPSIMGGDSSSRDRHSGHGFGFPPLQRKASSFPCMRSPRDALLAKEVVSREEERPRLRPRACSSHHVPRPRAAGLAGRRQRPLHTRRRGRGDVRPGRACPLGRMCRKPEATAGRRAQGRLPGPGWR